MRIASVGLLTISLVMGTAAVVSMRAYINANTHEPPLQEPQRPGLRIVVAATDIAFGAPLTDEVVRLTSWKSDDLPSGAFESLSDLTAGDPRYARTVIAAGEPILTAKATLPGQKPTLSAALDGNMRAVTIRVDDVLGVAGLVAPGDRVDVMMTRVSARAEGAEPTVDVLLQDVKVLALDQNASVEMKGNKDLRSITLEVSPDMAQKLALAANVGTLSLALRGNGEDTGLSEGRLTLSDLLGTDAAPEPVSAAPAAPSVPFGDLFGVLGGQLAGDDGALAGLTSKLQGLHSPAEPQPVRKTIEIYRGTERTLHDVIDREPGATDADAAG